MTFCVEGTAGVEEQRAWSFVLFGELQALQYGGSVVCEVEVERGGAKEVTGPRAKILNAMIMSLDFILKGSEQLLKVFINEI